MKYPSIILLCFLGYFVQSQEIYTYQLDQLQDKVEILTDEWGVPHIYAENELDLFFAQGFYAAKDRLFQFEIWRRQATGTVAEILGEREIDRDIGTRLFMFRGDLDEEFNHYHPRGKAIILAYTAGVNAYIAEARKQPQNLPIEFKILDILPELWTPKVVISRHQGLLGNIGTELDIARGVQAYGEELVEDLVWFHPRKPNITIHPKLKDVDFNQDILKRYNAYRKPLVIDKDHLSAMAPKKDAASDDYYALYDAWLKDEINDIGSNNWVLSGKLTESGYPMMANDPHRRLSTPSLRYMAHLVAPGWNVIGGGEPEIPGISIGHNEHGAWGLTVFRTDGEDMMVYELDPNDPTRYKYKGGYLTMKGIADTIKVKGQRDIYTTHWYTKHGPVCYIDSTNNRAFAIRCAWLEPGGSPYLASLAMDQAKNWEEFRDACAASHIPGENMVWADRSGNIGWQAVGIAPIRRNWSGLVPVPGDGSFEWDGYLPIKQKPHLYNPEKQYINTSNENVTPLDYKHWDAIGFTWSDPYRSDRVEELITEKKNHSMSDLMRMQTDYFSIPARQLMPLVKAITPSADEKDLTWARNLLLDWDYMINPESIAATIYVEWEKNLIREVSKKAQVKNTPSVINMQLKNVIRRLYSPYSLSQKFNITDRDKLVKECLDKALLNIKKRLGPDHSKWQYGQEKNKHVTIIHPMAEAVSDSLKQVLNVGPLPRGGYSYTVNNTSGLLNQFSGGSFRIITDTGDWDHTMATNSPGQNGDPAHPHYRNLFKLWAKDQYFPLFFSRSKIEAVTVEKWILAPKK